MKRIMALTAIVSVLALFVLTSQASAQDGPLLTADPPAVEGPGTYTFTLTGSGWSASPIFIVPCTVPGEQLTTASSTDAIVAALEGMGQADCVLAPLGAPIVVGGDGTFTVEITHDVPANFAFGAGDAGGTEDGAAPVLFIAEDMGDDMAPDGAAETGFGGMAGSDGNSVAVPLAATLAAVVLLGGAAIVTRRHA
ncbi:MAG: hypothetical protein F4Y12_14080 [Acidimicrobiaceae bacterium]|nr:hypothetical protein [Acidimicrobiaceae bacterium]MYH78606.1 hypothetical protein [Acidimicrobiaceae bacterium]